MLRLPQYDQARFLVGHIRSTGIDVDLIAGPFGLRVAYRPLHEGIRMDPEVEAQTRALRGEILTALYEDNTRPMRVVGRRAVTCER